MTNIDNTDDFDETFDIKYVGPFPQVEMEIPTPNGRTRWLTVNRGELVTVEADHAARLCRQIDTWRGRNDEVRAEIEAHQQALGVPVAGSDPAEDEVPAVEAGENGSDTDKGPDGSDDSTANPEEN